MRILRFEFGLWKCAGKIAWKEYFELSYMNGSCGCHILTISRFYFTWLGNECYEALDRAIIGDEE